MKKHIATGLALILTAGLAHAQGSDKTHKEVYNATRGSVVAIRAMAPLGERSGSGVIIDEKGTILTSYSACPEGSSKIRVWTAGPKLYHQKRDEVEIIGHSKRDEITLLRLKKNKTKKKFQPVTFGKSSALKIGQVVYTSGNAANSIINDDQPAFNLGVVSGIYRLNKERATSVYRGLVIETTAAVNVKMEGAPLLNRRGQMVGFVTMNYSPHRFLGCAIPTDGLHPILKKIQEDHAEMTGTDEPAEVGKGHVGMELADKGGKVLVAGVTEDGPAFKAGLRKGDQLIAVGSARVRSAKEFWDRVKDLQAGAMVDVTIESEFGRDKTTITLEKKK